MRAITYGDIALIPIIVGLVQVIKMILPKRWDPRRLAPLIALIIGILLGTIYLSPESLKDGVLIGIMLGLSASGLYSGTKNITQSRR